MAVCMICFTLCQDNIFYSMIWFTLCQDNIFYTVKIKFGLLTTMHMVYSLYMFFLKVKPNNQKIVI